MKENKKLLVVAAHPDDEILGCGATVARLVREGWTAATLILGEGVTSRGNARDPEKCRKELEDLRRCRDLANREIGVRRVFGAELPDNRFDGVDLLDIVKIVDRAKTEFKPSLIFTHHRNDLNVDHRRTYDAVLTATRPMEGESVRRVLSFEVLSSTEWNYPASFAPNVFYAVGATLEKKIAAMRRYKSELRAYPHPRSLKAIRNLAEYHGIRAGLGQAEAFELVRENNSREAI